MKTSQKAEKVDGPNKTLTSERILKAAEAVAEEGIPPIDTKVASYVWLGAMGEITVRWLYTGTPKNLASILP